MWIALSVHIWPFACKTKETTEIKKHKKCILTTTTSEMCAFTTACDSKLWWKYV